MPFGSQAVGPGQKATAPPTWLGQVDDDRSSRRPGAGGLVGGRSMAIRRKWSDLDVFGVRFAGHWASQFVESPRSFPTLWQKPAMQMTATAHTTARQSTDIAPFERRHNGLSPLFLP